MDGLMTPQPGVTPFTFNLRDENGKRCETQHAVEEVQAFAWGLRYPSHLDRTPEEHLLCSEFMGGRVVDVTNGGDFTDAQPFAWGFRHPAGILGNFNGRTLIVDTGLGAVLDVTGGGDARDAKKVFCNIPGPYGLISYQGDLYCTFSTDRENGLVHVEEGGSFSWDHVRIRGFPNGLRSIPYFRTPDQKSGSCGCWTAIGYEGRLVYIHAGLGMVFDVTEHKQYSVEVPIIARGLKGPMGLFQNPGNRHLYVAERDGGSIKAIPHDALARGGADMRWIPPIATGFKEPSCLRFSLDSTRALICDFGSSAIWTAKL